MRPLQERSRSIEAGDHRCMGGVKRGIEVIAIDGDDVTSTGTTDRDVV